jgi:hypothetical protein
MLFGYMTRLSLTEFNMQWNITNVNDTNNTFSVAIWDTSGSLQTTVRVSVQNDFYTLPNLVRSLVDQLNADASDGELIQWTAAIGRTVPKNVINDTARAGTTVVVNDPTVVLTQTDVSTSTRRFTIIPYDATSVIDGAGIYRPTNLPPLLDDLTNMLGLTPTSQSILPCPTQYTGSFASTMYTPFVDIVSNRLTKNQNVQDGTTQKSPGSNKLARVYLAPTEPQLRMMTMKYNSSGDFIESTDNAIGTAPFVLLKEFQTPKVIAWNTTENVDNIDLRVVDYRGNTLNIEPNVRQIPILPSLISRIGNTADFQFTLMATEQ